METKNTSLDRRMIAGLLLIIAGGLLLLDSLGMISFDLRHYLISWKTLLIFIGIISLSSRDKQGTGYILIGLGVIFWIPELFDYRVRLSTIFWPSILIGIGLLVITRRGRSTSIEGTEKTFNAFRGGEKATEISHDFVEDTAIFGGGNSKFTSTNFRGGRITAIFGGSDLNMLDATPSPEGCVIDELVIFGGSNLIIPDDWQVKSEVVSIFGGFSDKRLMPMKVNSEKMVIIKGVVLFGGIELKSYPR
jgi:predicted membrane protein